MQGRLTHALFTALRAFHASRVPVSFFMPVSASRKEAEDKAFDYNADKTFARAVSELRVR